MTKCLIIINPKQEMHATHYIICCVIVLDKKNFLKLFLMPKNEV